MLISKSKELRYYLWADNRLQRIPNQLHREIVNGSAAFPQFASSKQKIIEAVVRKVNRNLVAQTRGTIYSFDAAGRLDMSTFSEASMFLLTGIKPIPMGDNVVNLGPATRHRRWLAEQVWEPPWSVKRMIAQDIQGGRKIPRLRTEKSISLKG